MGNWEKTILKAQVIYKSIEIIQDKCLILHRNDFKRVMYKDEQGNAIDIEVEFSEIEASKYFDTLIFSYRDQTSKGIMKFNGQIVLDPYYKEVIEVVPGIYEVLLPNSPGAYHSSWYRIIDYRGKEIIPVSNTSIQVIFLGKTPFIWSNSYSTNYELTSLNGVSVYKSVKDTPSLAAPIGIVSGDRFFISFYIITDTGNKKYLRELIYDGKKIQSVELSESFKKRQVKQQSTEVILGSDKLQIVYTDVLSFNNKTKNNKQEKVLIWEYPDYYKAKLIKLEFERLRRQGENHNG